MYNVTYSSLTDNSSVAEATVSTQLLCPTDSELLVSASPFFCFGSPVSSMPKSHGTCCKYFLLVRPSWIPLHEVKKRRICWVTSTPSTESQQPIAAPKALKFCAQFLEN